jgi:hypothetical protein
MRSFKNRSIGAAIALLLLLLSPLACHAFGGKLSYPDGSAAAGAQVTLQFFQSGGRGGEGIRSDGSMEMTVTCDSNGRFSFSAPSAELTMLRVRAADGRNFAMFTLPTKVFSEGEVAIVLQRSE